MPLDRELLTRNAVHVKKDLYENSNYFTKVKTCALVPHKQNKNCLVFVLKIELTPRKEVK